MKENPFNILDRPLNTKIYICPNRDVIIAPNRYKGTSYPHGTSFNDERVKKLHSWISCFPFVKKRLHMDKNILLAAREIVDRKIIEKHGENEKDVMKCRIEKLEMDLEKVIQMMKQNEANIKTHFDQVSASLNRLHNKITTHVKSNVQSSNPESSEDSSEIDFQISKNESETIGP